MNRARQILFSAPTEFTLHYIKKYLTRRELGFILRELEYTCVSDELCLLDIQEDCLTESSFDGELFFCLREGIPVSDVELDTRRQDVLDEIVTRLPWPSGFLDPQGLAERSGMGVVQWRETVIKLQGGATYLLVCKPA